MKSVVRMAAAGVAALLVAGVALAFAHPQEGAKAADPAKVIVPFFGNETCPTTGKPINKTKYVDVDGQRVYFCCSNCLTKAKADPKAAMAAAYKDPKPAGNKTCPVSGHAIEAGKGKDVTFEGRKISLCCGDCEPEFKKTPLLFVTAAVYGAEDLKNAKCPVMKVNEGKDEDSCDDDLVVYKGKIIRLCCSDCIPDFVKEPEKYMAKATGK